MLTKVRAVTVNLKVESAQPIGALTAIGQPAFDKNGPLLGAGNIARCLLSINMITASQWVRTEERVVVLVPHAMRTAD